MSLMMARHSQKPSGTLARGVVKCWIDALPRTRKPSYHGETVTKVGRINNPSYAN